MTPNASPGNNAEMPACTRYTIRTHLGDWWAGRRDKRGLTGVDIDRLAQLNTDEPAAHLRWVRALSADFNERDRRLYACLEEALASDIEKLNETLLSLERLSTDAAAAHLLLNDFPPISERELLKRAVTEAEDDESVIQSRRTREYEARCRPLAARAADLHDRHAAAQCEIAERTARIHLAFDTTRQIAIAQHAFYTKRVETYLRTLLHRNPQREAVMALLPSPAVVRPGWFDQPCPWPSPPVITPTEEAYL